MRRALAAGAREASSRLGATFAGSSLAIVVLLAVSVARLERLEAPSRAADLAVAYAVLGLALPLLAHAVVGRVLAGGRPDAALAQLVRHGGDARGALLGTAAVAVLAAALPGAVAAAVAALAGHGSLSAASLRDAATSAWIASLGAIAYTCLFVLGSGFGRRGGGRHLLLLLDLTLGATGTAVASCFPRAHLLALGGALPAPGLGAVPPSVGALLGLGLAALVVAVARTPR